MCHVCDEIIDGNDTRCFSCNTERSRHNRKFYIGTSTLPKLDGEAAAGDEDDEDDEDD